METMTFQVVHPQRRSRPRKAWQRWSLQRMREKRREQHSLSFSLDARAITQADYGGSVCVCVCPTRAYHGSCVRVNKFAHRHRYLHMYTRSFQGFSYFWTRPGLAKRSRRRFSIGGGAVIKAFHWTGFTCYARKCNGIRGYRDGESFYGPKETPHLCPREFALSPSLSLPHNALVIHLSLITSPQWSR